jgi:hypothetical protein
MVSRVALLIRIATALNLDWVLETPLSSVMPYHPRLIDIFAQFVVFMVKLHCLQTYVPNLNGDPRTYIPDTFHMYPKHLWQNSSSLLVYKHF